MKGLTNFLTFIYENYVAIVVCIGLIVGIIQRVLNFFTKSDEEKLDIAKEQIQQTILKLVTEAEVGYKEWTSAGSIKRAQVIDQLYEKFPILSKITDQESITAWIDSVIDGALETLDTVISKNVEGTGE